MALKYKTHNKSIKFVRYAHLDAQKTRAIYAKRYI